MESGWSIVRTYFSKRNEIFLGYEYYEYHFFGKEYVAYEIGMGKEGIKIPLYDVERQIALIEKSTVVYDNKDEYDIYAIDAKALEIAVLFNLYYDFTRFGRFGEFAYKSKETEYLYTLKKELKSKYDPNFKELCK